jgi:hypothetical protein
VISINKIRKGIGLRIGNRRFKIERYGKSVILKRTGRKIMIARRKMMKLITSYLRLVRFITAIVVPLIVFQMTY